MERGAGGSEDPGVLQSGVRGARGRGSQRVAEQDAGESGVSRGTAKCGTAGRGSRTGVPEGRGHP